jgi:hypothetical protein
MVSITRSILIRRSGTDSWTPGVYTVSTSEGDALVPNRRLSEGAAWTAALLAMDYNDPRWRRYM